MADTLERVRPLDDQCGVLVAVGGRISSLDLFDKPSMLAAYWDGLLAGCGVRG